MNSFDPRDLELRHHARLERLVTFNFRLRCRTGLHIGAGKSADLAGSDLPVMRDASGAPLVPGSSLRGVLRSGIEAVITTLGLDRVRSLAPPSSPGATELALAWQRWPLVERLFGRVADRREKISYGSRLQISDARCLEAAEEPVAVELRDGVGIDRETRTAGNSVKFDHEVVPAGTCFEGRVRFKNPADFELGLVAQALWMLDEGLLSLGGKSARGLGWMEVTATLPRDLPAAELLRQPLGPAPEASGRAAEFLPVATALGAYFESLETLRRAAESLPPTVPQKEAV